MKSYKREIYRDIKNIIYDNKIPIDDYSVKEQKVLETYNTKKVLIYIVTLKFNKNKILEDYKDIITDIFKIRFKVYRRHTDFTNNTFIFYLKKQNMNVLDKLLD